jgi:cell wall-associated NlpC family hydrolase
LEFQDSRMGKYVLESEVGQGELGVLYRAHDLDDNGTVAVKVLNPLLGSEIEALRAAARLEHPNIAAIFDFGQAEGRHIYVREFVKGQSLAERLSEQKPLPRQKSLSFLRQTAAALDYAHAQGTIHGGLKPSNIIIERQESVKVTDFGFERPPSEMRRTSDRSAIDTLPYASPEQARGEILGPASDLYSLALVAYEMFAGEPPLAVQPASDTKLQPEVVSPPPLSSKRPEFSSSVDQIFKRALAEEPERRYRFAASFVAALAEALDDQPAYAADAPFRARADAQAGQKLGGAPRVSPRHWGALAGLGLLLIALLVGVLAFAGRGEATDPKPTVDFVAALTTVARPAVAPATPAPADLSEASTPTPANPTPDAAPTTTVSSPSSGEPGSVVTVQVPVADVRAEPDHRSELVTQVILGEAVKIQERQDGWYLVSAVDQPSPKHPDGYPGWLEVNSISLRTYRPEQVAIVIAPSAPIRTSPEGDGPVMIELSIDSRLAVQTATGDWMSVLLPDGREGWVSRDHVRLVCADGACANEVTAESDAPRSIEEILATAQQFIGTPYLWGGASSSAFDCSGFIYRIFHANGVTIPRDSQPMAETGIWVDREMLQPGDIVFLASRGPSGGVTHSALYFGNGQVLTTVATGTISIVPLESPRYRTEYWGARRYP